MKAAEFYRCLGQLEPKVARLDTRQRLFAFHLGPCVALFHEVLQDSGGSWHFELARFDALQGGDSLDGLFWLGLALDKALAELKITRWEVAGQNQIAATAWQFDGFRIGAVI